MKKTHLSAVILLTSFALAACSPDAPQSGDSSTVESSQVQSEASQSSETSEMNITIATGKDTETTVPAAGTLVMRQLYTAPHGTKSFAAVNVLMNGDKIVDAHLDEFQYLTPGDFTGVPNSDGGFGESFPADTVLASKEQNDAAYSKMMADKAQATQTWQQSITAITDFTKGKTVAELEETVKSLEGLSEDESPADVISGATFTDSLGYLQSIIDTATEGAVSIGAETTATDFKTAQLLGAPHGDKSFAMTTVALDGDKIAAVFMDEFQYVDLTTFGGVPNSDSDFGQGVADGVVLASKIANNKAYSAMMAEKGGSTNDYAANMKAIQDFTIGKTVAELEATIGELDALGEEDSPADVISGATFSDSKGYLQAIIDTAKTVE